MKHCKVHWEWFGKPFDFLSSGAAYQADSLAFSQHIQYLKTKGLAFIGDFQGKLSMSNEPAMYIY